MSDFTKRWIAALVAVLVLAFAVYGSGREMRTADAAEIGETSWLDRKETIYFWYADEKMTDFINRAAVEFGERENVHVIPHLSSEENFLEDLYAASLEEANQMPDLCLLGHETLEKAYLAGLASEIRDPDGICSEENFSNAALASVTYQGRLVGYPLSFDTSALVYNRTYLGLWAFQQAYRDLSTYEVLKEDENGEVVSVTETVSDEDIDPDQLQELTDAYYAEAIPTTLEDLLRIANTFDAPLGVTGVMSWDVANILYNYWIVGGAISVGGDSGDDRDAVSVAGEEAAACLREYQKLNEFFSIDTSETTYETCIRDFLDGKILFTVASTDIVATLDDARMNDEIDFEYGVATMPDVSEDNPSRSLSVTSVVCVSAYSHQAALANRFAQFLVTEGATNLHALAGIPAAYYGGNENSPAEMEAFEREYANSVPLPKMMETENFWMQLEVLFAHIWNGADVTEELADLEKMMEILLGNGG